MRRTERKLGEQRVFLGSLSKKNNLKTTYERLNLEEKAFISSTKFNQRQLLSRQTKLRQLQTNGNRGVNLETRPKTRTSFPDLAGSSESVIRSYSNHLTLPYSRNGLRSLGEGKRLSSLLGKEGSIKQTKSDNINKYISQSNASNNFVDLKDVSTEKRNEIKTPFRSAKVDSRSKQVQRSGLHVGDIIAYSASYGKRAKPQRRVSSIDQEGDVKIGGNEISEVRRLSQLHTYKQMVTNLQQTCSNTVPTACQQDVFALLVPSLLTSCQRLVDKFATRLLSSTDLLQVVSYCPAIQQVVSDNLVAT